MQIRHSLIGHMLVMKSMEVHLHKDGSNQVGKMVQGHGTRQVGTVLEVGVDFRIQSLCNQEEAEVSMMC